MSDEKQRKFEFRRISDAGIVNCTIELFEDESVYVEGEGLELIFEFASDNLSNAIKHVESLGFVRYSDEGREETNEDRFTTRYLLSFAKLDDFYIYKVADTEIGLICFLNPTGTALHLMEDDDFKVRLYVDFLLKRGAPVLTNRLDEDAHLEKLRSQRKPRSAV